MSNRDAMLLNSKRHQNVSLFIIRAGCLCDRAEASTVVRMGVRTKCRIYANVLDIEFGLFHLKSKMLQAVVSRILYLILFDLFWYSGDCYTDFLFLSSFMRHRCSKKSPWEKYLVTLLGAGSTQNAFYIQQCNFVERARGKGRKL